MVEMFKIHVYVVTAQTKRTKQCTTPSLLQIEKSNGSDFFDRWLASRVHLHPVWPTWVHAQLSLNEKGALCNACWILFSNNITIFSHKSNFLSSWKMKFAGHVKVSKVVILLIHELVQSHGDVALPLNLLHLAPYLGWLVALQWRSTDMSRNLASPTN